MTLCYILFMCKNSFLLLVQLFLSYHTHNQFLPWNNINKNKMVKVCILFITVVPGTRTPFRYDTTLWWSHNVFVHWTLTHLVIGHWNLRINSHLPIMISTQHMTHFMSKQRSCIIPMHAFIEGYKEENWTLSKTLRAL